MKMQSDPVAYKALILCELCVQLGVFVVNDL